uniref:beta-1,3-galactosyltransferase 2-like isoform X2 n=1 Tax=Myxine glutinosa TaxID=7769 RepID=UPI00358E4E4C
MTWCSLMKMKLSLKNYNYLHLQLVFLINICVCLLVLLVYMKLPTSWKIYQPKFLNQNLIVTQELNLSSSQFKYLLNEKWKCRNATPFLILLIISRPSEKTARQIIRETWGGISRVNVTSSERDFVVKITHVFMLGQAYDAKQEVIELESLTNKDIVQQDFMDTYRNLTLKTMMALHWLQNFCPKAVYAMKVDSDVYLNVQNLVRKVLRPELPHRHDYLTGFYMENFAPVRDPLSKWYVSEDVYAPKLYPPFCSGTGYVFSTDLASKIISIAPNVTYVELEDVFVSLCLKKIGIAPQAPPQPNLFNNHFVPYTPCTYHEIITSHELSPNQLLLYWTGVFHTLLEC